LKLRWGGALRQAGIIAAACDYALDHHVARLADDHANARRFAAGLQELPGITIDPAEVETNLVYFDVGTTGYDAAAFTRTLQARGVRMVPMGATRVRAVAHLDIDGAAIDRAIGMIRAFCGEMRQIAP
jgi:threonine aldolase